ncbi:YdaS family helix-turn-helix protein [Pseudoalteromonas sp. SaAl2]
MTTQPALQKAIATLGGQVKLADAIQTSQQNVSNWLRNRQSCAWQSHSY